MIGKLLIDECLSPELVQMAVEAGHVESTCVRNRGWAGRKDWELMTVVVAGDFTLVTNTTQKTFVVGDKAIWAVYMLSSRFTLGLSA